MKNILIMTCAVLLQTACTNYEIWTSSDSSLPAEMFVDNQASSRPSLTIKNEGKAVEVSRAVAIARDEDTLISIRVIRRKYQPLPHGAHIDLLIYGYDNQLIETETKRLHSHQFLHRPNGSFLPANINVSIDSNQSDIASIEIIAHSDSHNHHSVTPGSHE